MIPHQQQAPGPSHGVGHGYWFGRKPGGHDSGGAGGSGGTVMESESMRARVEGRLMLRAMVADVQQKGRWDVRVRHIIRVLVRLTARLRRRGGEIRLRGRGREGVEPRGGVRFSCHSPGCLTRRPSDPTPMRLRQRAWAWFSSTGRAVVRGAVGLRWAGNEGTSRRRKGKRREVVAKVSEEVAADGRTCRNGGTGVRMRIRGGPMLDIDGSVWVGLRAGSKVRGGVGADGRSMLRVRMSVGVQLRLRARGGVGVGGRETMALGIGRCAEISVKGRARDRGSVADG